MLNKKHGYYTADDVAGHTVEIPAGWEPEMHTTNDFAYLKLPYAYLNVPLFQRPDWILPAGAISPVVRQPNYPVKRAFRTAGIIRGPHPYGLVVDDYQRNDKVAHYDWNMTLEEDIQIVSMKKTSDREMDILLSGADPDQTQPAPKAPLPALATSGPIPQGQPMLLVRSPESGAKGRSRADHSRRGSKCEDQGRSRPPSGYSGRCGFAGLQGVSLSLS